MIPWYSIIDKYNGGFLEFFSKSYIARLDLKEAKVPDDSKVNSFVISVSQFGSWFTRLANLIISPPWTLSRCNLH